MVPRNMLTGAIPTNVDKLYVPWTVADDDDDGKKRFKRTHLQCDLFGGFSFFAHQFEAWKMVNGV